MDLTERVTFHGWVEDIPSFLRDMNYVISTSQWEGCPNNILEAMACGIRPIIHNWMGARELFPEECVFSSLEEVPAMLAPSAYHAERYRTWIEERFNTADTYPAFDAILASVLEDSHR
jgi:glycosyltransferase involved in cell wall biosynthesis